MAFCFSMTIGVLWEFFECFMDQMFLLDMQKDTIVHLSLIHILTQKNAGYQNLVYCDHSTAGMRFASIPYRTIEKVVKIHRSPTCS